ncbi:MAG TPA: sulfotransferase family 2 domain-containing protein [Sphingopyxis sp.]|nr:sulfotransferase family 2 domain-containing protein [Sphingopyxis sp.]HMP46503.1 sulfotransferase family 2 domain-containing protein [Sphingopyxis sp.]HMQ17887.1 sulfotransferase family 2 domain-containing protein [Sphingopyxis sp.]
MILSFSRRFAFIAIPKTAGHALRTALRPLLAPSDWEQCTLFDKRYFPVQTLAAYGHGHLSFLDVQPFLLPGQWDVFTSFAVVRSPFDRFLSFARFAWRKTGEMERDPLGTMKRALTDPARRDHILLRPQHEFVCDAQGRIRTTLLLRHENLARDMDRLAEALDAPLPPLEAVNVSPATAGAVLDAELADLIRARYARDFALFGYDPAAVP